MSYTGSKKAEYDKAWRLAHPENVKAWKKRECEKRRKKRQKWLADYKKKLSCKVCGESCSCCLDFHHKDPTTKKFAISAMSRVSATITKVLEEIAKCEILCANCHRKKHFREMLGKKALEKISLDKTLAAML